MGESASFWRNRSGAVAATYAIALTGLIIIGGAAFDYTRIMALDSELQNAADQAALGSVTQLDQTDGACARAGNAAVQLLSNISLLANDSLGNGLTVNGGNTVSVANDQCAAFPGVKFYSAPGALASTDETARFVTVAIDVRTARYAFTPIGGLISNDARAFATAGLGNSICRAPPAMICNPNESADPAFTIANYVGRGIKLVSVGNGGSWVPGNFGYLDTGGGSNGLPGLREALGWETAPGDCLEYNGLDTKPGATVPATDAINTRFDIYTNVACPSGGACPASINTAKDVQRRANAAGNNSCTIGNQGWQLPSGYYGETAITGVLPTTTTPSVMGHPRDICHLTGSCAGPIGNGSWDRDAYFRTNYVRANNTRWSAANWQTNTGLTSSATRYQVYDWEINHRGQVIDGVTVLGPRPANANGNTLQSRGQPVCSPAQGYGAGTVPGGTTTDRRRFPVAVVNCTAQGVSGNSTGLQVAAWVDVFLVEPSLARTYSAAGDVYIEVVGQSELGGGGNAAAQNVVRSTPYLVE